jgi:signal transduction histidine kinase
MPQRPPLDRITGLISAAAAVVGETDLEHLLRRLVSEARVATGAPYAALGVLGEHGVLSDFIYEGIDDSRARMIGHLPTGRGVLGSVIRENITIRLDAISDHPDSVGFPDHHPPMITFLGVPVAVADRSFGNLYLTDKDGGFTDEDVVVIEALSRIAGTAVQTERLQARLRGLAVVEERQRIARDLHDSVIQDLFAVGLGLQTLSTRVDDESAVAVLDDSVDRLDQSVDTLRDYIFELKQNPSDSLPLAERLQELVSRMGSAYPARVRLTVEGAGRDPSRRDEDLTLLASEALSNALRHAGAENVSVILDTVEGGVLMVIADDGSGFDPEQIRRGLGIANMKARAESLGGEFEIDSAPGSGTTVRFSLPSSRPS